MPRRKRRLTLVGLFALALVIVGPVGWAAPNQTNPHGWTADLRTLIERVWSALELSDWSLEEGEPEPQNASSPPADSDQAADDEQEISPFIDPNG